MPPESLNILLALVAFGLVHSFTASFVFKRFMRSLLGNYAYEGLYRLLYNAFSVLTLAPIWWWMNAEGGRWLWQVEGTPALLLTLIRYAGGLGLLISLLQIDSLRFIGWRQLVAFLKGQPLPLAEEPFVTWGVYALVRHPLYFFSLIFLWVTPAMSAASFGFALGATLYFALGSLLEERKLLAVYGETYRAYRQRVAWLVPFVKLPAPLKPLQKDGGY